MYEKFTNVYKLSKTLRFELRPIGKTLDNIEKSGVLKRDHARAEEYGRIKDILDAGHKALLERTLSSVEDIDWRSLANSYEVFRNSNKDKQARAEIDGETLVFRKRLVQAFAADAQFKDLTDSTPSKYLKSLAKSAIERGEQPEHAIELFSSFASYLAGFQENRANIYSSDKQVTSAAHRAVNENFPRFLECCRIYHHIEEKYGCIVEDVEHELSEFLTGRRLRDFFNVDHYSKFLPQSGIDDFNFLIGGGVSGKGVKLRGLNEFINLRRQQDEAVRIDRKLVCMPKLYKQILSDRETLSFVSEQFENDASVLAAVRTFGESLAARGTVRKMQELLSGLEASGGVFIDSEKLPDVSRWLCGGWYVLGNAMKDLAETKFSHVKVHKKREDEISSWLKRAEYSLAELNGALNGGLETSNGANVADVTKCWKNEEAGRRFSAVTDTFLASQKAFVCEEETGLAERKNDVAAIKAYLDAVMDILHFVRPLRVGAELQRDMELYGEFDSLYAELEEVVPLYNLVRNYVTRKPSEISKIKLMFDCPTLAKGWDKNCEMKNKALLFEREGHYYLGIVNPMAHKRPTFEGLEKPSPGVPVYKKMTYKLLPGPNKMLPKVFFSAKGLPIYKPSDELLEKYRRGCYKKGAEFDIDFCRQLIDFFKRSIEINPDWKSFGFNFSPTESYNGIDEFYREISDQGYRVTFCDIAADVIDRYVDEGSLYLFCLHNKDFATGTTGRPNLHTMYWKMLFNTDNLTQGVFKLNGEAELFYRRASITKPYVHAVGEKLVNRRDNTGRPIPESAFGELFSYANGLLHVERLGAEARALLNDGQVTIKDVSHEIVKDARYTKDKFFFHVPITINARASDKPQKFNDRVNAAVRDSMGVNVIGIDRGERNLLYVTVINTKGEILEQRSFNTLEQKTYDGHTAKIDYHAKLDQREKARDAARKSWSEIGKIKDLKSGYLSIVVHEIARLMVKYNAIVALEDLNFGFKRGRFGIEKQVYQKFEKALIDKLNYLVFKDVEPKAAGGVLNGLQLADKFTSFERLGKQTGFVYYVPAAYTSKIDPTTGFTNLFDTKKCTNAENIKAFFSYFDSIRFVASNYSFAFAFDYVNFKTRFKGFKTDWVVYTADRRLVYDPKAKSEKEIHPTQLILDALAALGSSVSDGFDLKECLMNLPATRENAAFFRTVFYAFERTLQMRNSSAKTGEDYIHSPVRNSSGRFFDSRTCGDDLPRNADANGAYHIALKGLWIATEALHEERPDLKLEHETWLQFAQSRN